MMVYKFDEELQRMIYIYEESPENKIMTDEGMAWYREQIEIAKEVGVDHYLNLIANLANEMYKEKN